MNTSGGGLATFNKATNGYYKFNNGLIIQWGLLASNGRNVTLTFPQPFTGANSYGLSITQCKTSSSTEFNNFYLWRVPRTTTGATLYIADSTAHMFSWLAIGY